MHERIWNVCRCGHNGFPFFLRLSPLPSFVDQEPRKLWILRPLPSDAGVDRWFCVLSIFDCGPTNIANTQCPSPCDRRFEREKAPRQSLLIALGVAQIVLHISTGSQIGFQTSRHSYCRSATHAIERGSYRRTSVTLRVDGNYVWQGLMA